jgi:hypothetical protein
MINKTYENSYSDDVDVEAGVYEDGSLYLTLKNTSGSITVELDKEAASEFLEDMAFLGFVSALEQEAENEG